MATSTQLTDLIVNDPNPRQAELDIWSKTRYLVAQRPASVDFSETVPGYYKGRVVIPGPKANTKVSEMLSTNDLNILKARHHIRFTDNRTTDNAGDNVRESLYTVMSKVEADEYERILSKYHAANPSSIFHQYHKK